MKFYVLIGICSLIGIVLALPVSQQKPSSSTEKPPTQGAEDNLGDILEYERYLREVVEALESDPEFRKKLDKAPEADIRSGKLAQELEYVNHHVRSKLDEIKRREIERLRELASRQYELSNDIDRKHMKIGDHLQPENEHTFEIEDLRRLILKTSADLAEADRKRREEFKQYELQKEFEKQQKLQELDEEHKKEYEEELKKQKETHNKHEKVHHPGNRAQLEEVWEKQDQMDGQDFDPKVFFKLHDLDGNGVWDENELKALFVKELDKVYKQGNPEDDMRERIEEMERMREHVFKEWDTNRDGLISFQEFMEQTNREEFNRDPGWETVDNVPQYTHEEYLEFERRRQEEIQRLVAQGVLPPHPNMPHGYYPNGQPHPNQQQLHYQQQPQYHQQQVHHQQQQQQVHQQYQPNPSHQQQQYQQQVNQPPPQQYQGQHHQQQQYQQAPQQQQYQQVPQQQQYQQPPQQQQYQQNQQQQQYQQPNQQPQHNPPSQQNQQAPQQQHQQQQAPAQNQQPAQPQVQKPIQQQAPQQPVGAQQPVGVQQPVGAQQSVVAQQPVPNQQHHSAQQQASGNIPNANAIPSDPKHQQQLGKHN